MSHPCTANHSTVGLHYVLGSTQMAVCPGKVRVSMALLSLAPEKASNPFIYCSGCSPVCEEADFAVARHAVAAQLGPVAVRVEP